MAISYKDQLKKLDDEEKRIRDQRAGLQEKAKAEAMAVVDAALKDLNALGFNYRLVAGNASTQRAPRAMSASSGTRRSGIRDNVLSTISKAGPDGIKPAEIRAQLGIDNADKSGSQSVANALSNLKKAGKISDKDGAYVSA